MKVFIAAQRVVVVESSRHFCAGFAPLAKEIVYVATPGAINPDFASIKYTKRKAPYWPKVEDPFLTGVDLKIHGS